MLYHDIYIYVYIYIDVALVGVTNQLTPGQHQPVMFVG